VPLSDSDWLSGGEAQVELASDNGSVPANLCTKSLYLPVGVEYRNSRLRGGQGQKVLYQVNHPRLPKFHKQLCTDGAAVVAGNVFRGRAYANPVGGPISRPSYFSRAEEVIQWLRVPPV